MASASNTFSVEGFILGEKLGSGSYATVYKAYAKVTLVKHAVLIINKLKSNA